MLAAEEDGPCDAAGVLALQEERLGLALLEAEDLAVATDVELTLLTGISVSTRSPEWVMTWGAQGEGRRGAGATARRRAAQAEVPAKTVEEKELREQERLKPGVAVSLGRLRVASR